MLLHVVSNVNKWHIKFAFFNLIFPINADTSMYPYNMRTCVCSLVPFCFHLSIWLTHKSLSISNIVINTAVARLSLITIGLLFCQHVVWVGTSDWLMICQSCPVFVYFFFSFFLSFFFFFFFFALCSRRLCSVCTLSRIDRQGVSLFSSLSLCINILIERRRERERDNWCERVNISNCHKTFDMIKCIMLSNSFSFL